MRRRTVWAGAAGLGLGVAGLAWWWRGGEDPAQAALARFLAKPLKTPGGDAMDLSGFAGQALLLNFWATWCPPCVREMPELDRFAAEYAQQGGRVLGVAIDRPDAVQAFLAKTPVRYPVAVAGFDALPVLGELGNAAGALPYTLMTDRQGRLRRRKMGETRLEELRGWAT